MLLRDAQTIHFSDMLAVLARDSEILLVSATCLQANVHVIEGKKLRNA